MASAVDPEKGREINGTCAACHGEFGQGGEKDDSMSDAQQIRFCERGRDFALQAFYDRDKGRPMKQFAEDGSDGPRITNVIVRKIYEEPQISSPKSSCT